MKEENLQTVLEACERNEFNTKLTGEMCWNAGYALGRSRWYWGPRKWVSFEGWLRTQIAKKPIESAFWFFLAGALAVATLVALIK